MYWETTSTTKWSTPVTVSQPYAPKISALCMLLFFEGNASQLRRAILKAHRIAEMHLDATAFASGVRKALFSITWDHTDFACESRRDKILRPSSLFSLICPKPESTASSIGRNRMMRSVRITRSHIHSNFFQPAE